MKKMLNPLIFSRIGIFQYYCRWGCSVNFDFELWCWSVELQDFMQQFCILQLTGHSSSFWNISFSTQMLLLPAGQKGKRTPSWPIRLPFVSFPYVAALAGAPGQCWRQMESMDTLALCHGLWSQFPRWDNHSLGSPPSSLLRVSARIGAELFQTLDIM